MKSLPTNLLKKTNMAREFDQHNYEHLFERLKLVSYMLILTYPCFFIVDFVLFKNLDQPTFKIVLTMVHISGMLISLIFVWIYRSKESRVSKSMIVNSFVLLYLIIGAVSSINSQLFTKNLYAYIIILLAVAAIFPLNPRNILIHYGAVHIFFLLGLNWMESNHYLFLSMLINSTGTAVIAYTIALAFYTFRKRDFINKQRLSKSKESFRSLFNMNPKPLILMKLADFEIVLMNKQAIEYYQLNDLRNGSFLFSNEEEKQEILSRLERESRMKNHITRQQITPDLEKWSLLNFELIEYLDHTCVLIDTTDITAIKEKEAELVKHASIDVLTGVRNRRSGMEFIQEQLEASNEFILMFIDINNLKIVNDTYGHSSGDELIKICCELIHKHLSKKDHLFRLGGDEFIIIFLNKQQEEVQQFWARVEQDFDILNHSGVNPYQISASHGLHHYKPGTLLTVDDILEQADQEMYKVKSLRKDGILA